MSKKFRRINLRGKQKRKILGIYRFFWFKVKIRLRHEQESTMNCDALVAILASGVNKFWKVCWIACELVAWTIFAWAVWFRINLTCPRTTDSSKFVQFTTRPNFREISFSSKLCLGFENLEQNPGAWQFSERSSQLQATVVLQRSFSKNWSGFSAKNKFDKISKIDQTHRRYFLEIPGKI